MCVCADEPAKVVVRVCAKEPYILSEEPHILSKEPYIPSGEGEGGIHVCVCMQKSERKVSCVCV